MYLYICELYDKELNYYCQRYSNNSNPAFTDQKIMTIYLFTGYCQKYFLIKDIIESSPFYNKFIPLLKLLKNYIKTEFMQILPIKYYHRLLRKR